MAGDGLPSTYSQSQSFLKTFADRSGAKIYLDEKHQISKLGLDTTAGSYGSFKYDHEPHLLEYASCFHRSLGSLHSELSSVLNASKKVAEELGLKIVHSPTIPVDPEHPRTQRETAEYQNLRKFRKNVQKKLGISDNDGAANYAAVIASTQVNISIEGSLWNENPSFIPNLYRFERSILAFATLFSGADSRWNRYKSTYRGYKLLGFPDIGEWSYDSWLKHCLKSYIFQKDATTLSTLEEVINADPQSLPMVWKSLRDLQIIRPKPTGAVEFRADPCQPTVDHIMAITALRFGVNLICAELKNPLTDSTYEEEKQRWWNSVEKMTYEVPDMDFLQRVSQKLTAVEPSAARYLEPYFRKAGANAA